MVRNETKLAKKSMKYDKMKKKGKKRKNDPKKGTKYHPRIRHTVSGTYYWARSTSSPSRSSRQ